MVEGALAKIFSSPKEWLGDPESVCVRLLVIDSAYNSNLRYFKARLPATRVIARNAGRIMSTVDSRGNNAEEIGRLLGHLVAETASEGAAANVPSAISKFLHFVGPEVFPIWDNFALKSWRSVLKEAKSLGCSIPGEVHVSASADWSTNYTGLVNFYRWLIDSLMGPDDRAKMEKVARETPAKTLLAVLDKAFWAAGGGVLHAGDGMRWLLP